VDSKLQWFQCAALASCRTSSFPWGFAFALRLMSRSQGSGVTWEKTRKNSHNVKLIPAPIHAQSGTRMYKNVQECTRMYKNVQDRRFPKFSISPEVSMPSDHRSKLPLVAASLHLQRDRQGSAAQVLQNGHGPIEICTKSQNCTPNEVSTLRLIQLSYRERVWTHREIHETSICPTQSVARCQHQALLNVGVLHVLHVSGHVSASVSVTSRSAMRRCQHGAHVFERRHKASFSSSTWSRCSHDTGHRTSQDTCLATHC